MRLLIKYTNGIKNLKTLHKFIIFVRIIHDYSLVNTIIFKAFGQIK